MALQSSGAISFSDLQTEYGGENPISLDEYYKGGSYVPTTVETTGTVSSGSYTESENALQNWGGNYSVFWRYYENGSGNPPRYNQDGHLMYYTYWTDQAWTSGTGWVDLTLTVDLAGDYQVVMSAYNTGASRTGEVWVNDVSQGTFNLDTLSFSCEAGDEVRIYTSMTTIGNYNSLSCYLQTSNGNQTLSVNANENVPESGVIEMDDFYDGQKEY
jgi:hypothetical protein